MATTYLPHPMAQHIKPLFFKLYDCEYSLVQSDKESSPRDAISDSCPSSIFTSPSLESPAPSLIFSNSDTDSEESTPNSPKLEEDFISSDQAVLIKDAKDDSKHPPLLSVRPDVDSSAPPSPDLLPLTPDSATFTKIEDILSQRENVNLEDSPWHKALVSGTLVDITIGSNPSDSPYLEQLRYAHALNIVKSLPTWDERDLTALAQDLLWCAVEPKASEYLSLRDVKRITMLAGAVKSAFLELRGHETYAGFVDTLIDVSVGLFMNAWRIEVSNLNFSSCTGGSGSTYSRNRIIISYSQSTSHFTSRRRSVSQRSSGTSTFAV